MFKPLTVPGSLNSLKEIADYVTFVAEKANLNKKSSYLLKLAVDEIASNVIIHGYAEAKQKGNIQVHADLCEEYLKITLLDSGKHYNSLQKAPPQHLDQPLEKRIIGELGIHLALNAVDEFNYEQSGKWNRNIFIVYLNDKKRIKLKQHKNKVNIPYSDKKIKKVLSPNKDTQAKIVKRKKNKDRILIISSSEIDNSRLIYFLETLNYKVEVSNRSDAIKTLGLKKFTIILLALSALEDLKLITKIKHNVKFSHTPIIVLIQKNKEKLVDSALREGIDDYLSKNYTLHQLDSRLRSCLYKNQLEQQSKLELKYMKKLVEVGIALSGEKDFDHLLFTILNEAKSICNADGGTLYICENDKLKFAIILNDTLKINRIELDETTQSFSPLLLYDPKTGTPNTRNVATYVALNRRSINISDVYADTQFDFSGTKDFDKEYHYRTLSSLTVSLTNHENEVIGILQLINIQDPKTNKKIAFNPQIQQLTEAFASQGAVILNTRILLERQKELFRYERELQIGLQIQADFLPKTLPQAAGWEISARFTPAHEVGGDFYDAFFMSKEKTIGVIIADVADKGVGAALFMALFRTLIRALSKKENSDIDILINTMTSTNNYILENHMESNMFATLFFAQFDIETGLLKYVNAGHNAPIITGASGVKTRLDPTGPALGMFPDVSFEQNTIIIEPGELLFAFTDGVTEAKNPSDQAYTEAKLLRLLSNPPNSAAKLLTQVEQSVKKFVGKAEQFDDITMLSIRRSK